MINRNRLSNTKNPYQGDFPRVLCVCSAGLLRSPTIAWILSNPPYNCNTRAVGASTEFALIPVDVALVIWSDVIVCAERRHKEQVEAIIADAKEEHGISVPNKHIISLNVPDNYKTRDPELIRLIEEKLKDIKFSDTLDIIDYTE